MLYVNDTLEYKILWQFLKFLLRLYTLDIIKQASEFGKLHNCTKGVCLLREKCFKMFKYIVIFAVGINKL